MKNSLSWLCELSLMQFLSWWVRDIRQESRESTRKGHEMVTIALQSQRASSLPNPTPPWQSILRELCSVKVNSRGLTAQSLRKYDFESEDKESGVIKKHRV